MAESTKKVKPHFVSIFLICLIGAILSLMAHELLHIILHWGQITHVDFFPNPLTIIEVGTDLPQGYDIDGEEGIAYMITFIGIIITALVAFKVLDDNDERSPGEILFPDDPDLRKLPPNELWKQSGMEYILPESPEKEEIKEGIAQVLAATKKPKKIKRSFELKRHKK